jgi:DNA repair photolyase
MGEDFYESPRVSSQYIFCPMPFTMDTYDGCTHNCQYCFSYFASLINQANKGKNFWRGAKGVDLRHIERVFSNNPKTKKEKQLCAFVERKIPVHWGGITDPFSMIEAEHKKSLGILKILAKYQYPFIVSTKNKRLVTGEYYELLKQCGQNAVVQVSLISTNKKLELIETDPEIKIEDRLELIEKASKVCKKVVVRVQPFIPKFCDDTIEKTIEDVSKAGAKAVTVEFLKFSIFSLTNPILKGTIQKMGRKLGFDMLKYYQESGRGKDGDREVYPKFKEPSIKRMGELAHKAGLEFYVADNEMRDMGDGHICCGLRDDEAPNKSEFNINKMLFLAKKKGVVRFEDYTAMDADLFDKIGMDWLNMGTAEKRNRVMNMTYADRARMIWNSKGKHGQSMSKFFDKMKFIGTDKNGNSVYGYDFGKK